MDASQPPAPDFPGAPRRPEDAAPRRPEDAAPRRPEDAAPWRPELEVDTARAAELVRAQFPALAGASVEPLGEGWDNAAFLVGGTHVFRFPRRALAGRIMLGELAALPHLPRDLPLEVPRPSHRGEPRGGYPYVFAGYPLLRGTPAHRLRLTHEQRTRCAAPLARFLRRLHDLDPEPARKAGVFRDELRRLELPYRRDKVAGLLRAGVDGGWLENAARLERRILAALPERFEARDDALVHGDLYAAHLLVDAEGAPTGIIDWGDAHLGDPAGDLGLVMGFLPPAGREAFFAIYGEVDRERRAVARLEALQHALFLVPYARERRDAQLEAEARASLALLAEHG